MEIVFLVLLGVVVFIIWNQYNWQVEPWPQNALTVPPYQAHRGDRQFGARENQLEAFRQAKKSGAQMIELDVRLSADAQVIVFHDADLKRLFNEETSVNRYSAAELRAKYQIPTLAEVLLDRDVPALVNIEIKSGAYWDASLEKKVIAVIRETGASSRVLMSSFNPLSVRRFWRLAPEIPRALLATEEKAPDNRIYLRRLWLAPYVHPNLLHLDYKYVTDAELANFRRRQIPVALWTMNDKKMAEKYFSTGVISLISDQLYN